jgi:uncharacterized protein
LIHCDSSALPKLIREERESADLMRWYEARQEVDATTSSLVLVEVIRAARRRGAGAERKARAIRNGVDQLGALEVFVAYDKRLLVAAEQAGLPVESPGAA